LYYGLKNAGSETIIDITNEYGNNVNKLYKAEDKGGNYYKSLHLFYDLRYE
jgi:hypothetical protein